MMKSGYLKLQRRQILIVHLGIKSSHSLSQDRCGSETWFLVSCPCYNRSGLLQCYYSCGPGSWSRATYVTSPCVHCFLQAWFSLLSRSMATAEVGWTTRDVFLWKVQRWQESSPRVAVRVQKHFRWGKTVAWPLTTLLGFDNFSFWFFFSLQQLDILLGQFLPCAFGMGLTRCADRLWLQIAIIFIDRLREFI